VRLRLNRASQPPKFKRKRIASGPFVKIGFASNERFGFRERLDFGEGNDVVK